MVKFNQFDAVVIIAVLLARLLPNQVFSVGPLVYAFVHWTCTHNTVFDNFNFFLLSIVVIVYNYVLLYVLCTILGMPCFLRYAPLGALIPLHYIYNRSRTVCPVNRFSIQLLVIRLLWDPPTMFTAYVMYRLFGVRLLHDGHHNFVSYVNSRLLISSFPFASDVQQLYNTYRVRAVVNMCAEYAGPIEEYSRLHIAHLRLPTIDGSIPQPEDVKKAVEFIENRLEVLEEDKTVLVHCKAGRGRSAAVIVAYLVKNEGLSVQQAYGLLHSRRPSLESNVLSYNMFDEFKDVRINSSN